ASADPCLLSSSHPSWLPPLKDVPAPPSPQGWYYAPPLPSPPRRGYWRQKHGSGRPPPSPLQYNLPSSISPVFYFILSAFPCSRAATRILSLSSCAGCSQNPSQAATKSKPASFSSVFISSRVYPR